MREYSGVAMRLHASRADSIFGVKIADERLVPDVWNDVTGTRDMPWMGSGGRAHWYRRDVTNVEFSGGRAKIASKGVSLDVEKRGEEIVFWR